MTAANLRMLKGVARWFTQGVGAVIASSVVIIAPCALSASLIVSSPALSFVFAMVALFVSSTTLIALILYLLRRFSATGESVPEIQQARAIAQRLRVDPEFDGEVVRGALQEFEEEDTRGRGGLTEAGGGGALTEASARGAAAGVVADEVRDDAASPAAAGVVREDLTKKNVTFAQSLALSAKFVMAAYAASFFAVVLGSSVLHVFAVSSVAAGALLVVPALLVVVAWQREKRVRRWPGPRWLQGLLLFALGFAPTWANVPTRWSDVVADSALGWPIVLAAVSLLVAAASLEFARAREAPGRGAALEPARSDSERAGADEVTLGFEGERGEEVLAEVAQSVSDQ